MAYSLRGEVKGGSNTVNRCLLFKQFVYEPDAYPESASNPFKISISCLLNQTMKKLCTFFSVFFDICMKFHMTQLVKKLLIWKTKFNKLNITKIVIEKGKFVAINCVMIKNQNFFILFSTSRQNMFSFPIIRICIALQFLLIVK